MHTTKSLDEEHDKPRWMHRRYCEEMKNLSTNPHTREGMKSLISQVTVILNGFIRLKADNCRHISTSMVEAVMDTQLRSLWNQRTDKTKTTPPIEDLLQFIRDQADQLEDDPALAARQHSHQEKRVKHQQNQRYTGSTHSVVSTLPVSSNRGSQQSQQHQQSSSSRQPFTSNSSTCSLCQGSHHLFYCPTFEGYSVSQRKEHVMQQKLCLNCLKPNHVAHDCRSNYRCKAKDCGRKHNTLLLKERPAAPAQQQSTHQTNAAIHAETDEDDDLEECLLMTSQATLTGPTGKSITVRALLDSGSTLSILSSKVMKFLSLQRTGRYVAISGVEGKSTKKNHPLAKVTLSSDFKKEWSRRITVAGMKDLTRDLPFQEAKFVRNLPHIKGLALADEQFDEPGKVDILLGQNVWRHLFLEGKSKGKDYEPEAWETVFGWIVLGSYKPSSQEGAQQAITYVITTEEAGLNSDQLLSKFWELEEPSVYEPAKTPQKSRSKSTMKALTPMIAAKESM